MSEEPVELKVLLEGLDSQPGKSDKCETKSIERAINNGSKKQSSSEVGPDSPVMKQAEEKRVRETPPVPDPNGKLQHYYDVIAEKVSSDKVAHVVVWEGAAKNEEIKDGISSIVEEDSSVDSMDEDQAGLIAMLFSRQLDSDEKITQEFLPALKALATCDWEGIFLVSIYMLTMLVHKKEKDGISLAISTLPTAAFNHVFGDVVTMVCSASYWPECVVKMPQPDKLLSPEQFQNFILQDISSLGKSEARISWLFVLAYSPESIQEEVVKNLSKEFPWSAIFVDLSALFENKEYYNQSVVQRAITKLVRMWRNPTSLEQRKATLKYMREKLNFKEFERIMEQIISVATYPLEDLEDPCLVVASPNTQLALKLFRHIVQTLGGIDFQSRVHSLVKQGISDLTLAALVKEMSRMKIMDEGVAEDAMYSCTSAGLLQSCVELLRVAPNPRTHPFMEILEEQDERTCYRALELLTPNLYAPNCTNDDDRNALHLAATYGYTSVVKEILARGFHRLLNEPGDPAISVCNRRSVRPAAIAVQLTHFGTAKELFQAMDPADAKDLCMASSDISRPEINLHKVMEEMRAGRGGRWNERAKEEGGWKEVPVSLDKEEIQQRVEFMETVLDTMVDSHHLDMTLLIQDEGGVVSQQFSGGGTIAKPDPEKARKSAGRNLYQKIALCECEELKSHECFATLTSIVWIDYGIVQGMLFLLYILFMAFLTLSLVLAARSRDPRQYDSSLDWFRLFCEIVTLLWAFYDIALECHELGRIIYKSLKQHGVCVGHGAPQTTERGDSVDGASDSDDEEEEDDDNDEDGLQSEHRSTNNCREVVKDVLSEYFLDWRNMLDDLAIIFILLIIPFRIVDSDNQWVFAALAFMFHGLRIFKYAIMFKSVGEYVAILVLLIKRDVPQFVTVFVVIIFSLGGALYLSLVGHYSSDNIDTENNNDTSEIYLLWWTGFRILAEGSALTYYGPGGFNWLGILIYWLFLFIVVVVLLNILIAQFSKSYEEESERAQINVILTQTEIILKMEQSAFYWLFVQYIRKFRSKLTKSTYDFRKVERLQRFVGEREEEKPASSEQVEELQTQTTNLGLQLRKQMDDNTGKSTLKVEEIKTEMRTLNRETHEAIQKVKEELEGKLMGLERAVLDTRRYVDDIKDLLLSMKEKK